VHISNLNVRVRLQVFAQFGDKNVHTAGGEIARLAPDFLDRQIAVNNVVDDLILKA
jgi:hypothetical protein